MERKPKISVLLPAYNAEKYIRETIESILAQSYTDFELLIADDGSSDATRIIVDSFRDDRIKCFHNEQNIHKASTCNKLLSFAKGELVTIHDADDLSHPLRFEKLVGVFEQQPSIAMCGHNIQRMTEEGVLLPVYRHKTADLKQIKASMQEYNSDGDASIMLRREIVPHIGGLLRPYFKNNMDYDLALRIIEKFEVTNIPEVLLYYRNVPTSISKHITSYKKLTTQLMTQFFAKERVQRGTDSLYEGNTALIEKLEKQFAQPYKEDVTLYLRETAARCMSNCMYKEAIQHIWKAVKAEPFRLINLRTLQYCLRKSALYQLKNLN